MSIYIYIYECVHIYVYTHKMMQSHAESEIEKSHCKFLEADKVGTNFEVISGPFVTSQGGGDFQNCVFQHTDSEKTKPKGKCSTFLMTWKFQDRLEADKIQCGLGITIQSSCESRLLHATSLCVSDPTASCPL